VSKKKLIHFQENLSFPHLFQPNYSDLYPEYPMRSKWRERFFGNDHPITLELGCGKGEYTVGLAAKYPEKNFIGIDWKGARLWRGCKTVKDLGLTNVGFIRTQVDHIEQVFAPGEISEIWITFPDPQVRKERRRLTAPFFLDKYRNVLSANGIIHLKTDDPFFYSYTLDVIHDYSYALIWYTDDLYHAGTIDEVLTIQTYYEKRWLAMEKKICYLKFQLNTL